MSNWSVMIATWFVFSEELCLMLKCLPLLRGLVYTARLLRGSAVGMSGGSGVSARAEDALVWIDLEMTGLDPDRCHVLEAACVVTDWDLRTLGQCEVAVAQPESVLLNMDDWSARQHAASGLTERCRSSGALPLPAAEQRLLQLVQKHVPRPGLAPLAGNSVHVDRMFLHRHMPALLNHLHYRIVDVSSLKELARNWCPPVFWAARELKRGRHRALEDIHDSIAELRVYREHLFSTSTL